MQFRGATTDGWAIFGDSDEDDPRVFVRYGAGEGDALVVRDIVISSRTGAISAADLRDISVSRMEAQANHGGRDYWLHKLLALGDVHDEDDLIDRLRAVKRSGRRATKQVNPCISRPTGERPDVFYAMVADVYRGVAAYSSRPAMVIAEASDVPVATVRRWINEARRRGALPQGQRGRT